MRLSIAAEEATLSWAWVAERSGVLKTRAELSCSELGHVVERLRGALDGVLMPTVPAVAARVISLAGDPESSLGELSEVVTSDQALTGRVLRLVNSSAFGQRERVGSVHRAAVLLGMERLKALALGFHVSRLARKGGDAEATRRVWTASLYRAWVALHVAESVDRRVSGEAFVVGLLSDVGEPLMGEVLPKGVPSVVAEEVDPARRYLMEMRHQPFTHADVGRALGLVWGLPAVLVEAIGRHHERVSVVDAGDRGSVLRGVGWFAGSLPVSVGGGVEGGGARGDVGRAARDAVGLFGLTEAGVERVLHAAAADHRATVDLFEPVVDGEVDAEGLALAAHGCLRDWAERAVLAGLSRECDGKGERVMAGGYVYEMERMSNGVVRVYIADEAGGRVLSEQVDPSVQSVGEIRGALLLSGACDGEWGVVMDSIRKLAA